MLATMPVDWPCTYCRQRASQRDPLLGTQTCALACDMQGNAASRNPQQAVADMRFTEFLRIPISHDAGQKLRLIPMLTADLIRLAFAAPSNVRLVSTDNV